MGHGQREGGEAKQGTDGRREVMNAHKSNHGHIPPQSPGSSRSWDELIAGTAACPRLEFWSPSHCETATVLAISHWSGWQVLTPSAVVPSW